ncbi:Smg-4/UPF3 family-domain-containing protein [Cokeromyces recurvatus]|uniref:Smg-4/UPF3 family-domain-containing protein n=1 Tax=Cokeromyces recurvatus TaxID=90255 RepID=UPI002220B4ED|nr:Smg-4/UPF3 family-domain-containing protein [Cokeromyces recurvatus]KAI7898831.1 Smg-4/UPF3 family-domain-containing protein [Cokeromyces recurvatus]
MSAVTAVSNPPPTPIDTPTTIKSASATKTGNEEKKKKRIKRKSNRHSRKQPTLKTKVVVRRLPPNLPEEIFMNSVKPWVSEETVDYTLYVSGKLSKSGFDGHIFIDNRGTESRAVVEFSPYQKIPKTSKSVDARQGTIDEDPDYLNFLESLKVEEATQNEQQSEHADGLTQIERLENRIALVTAQTLAAEQASKPKTTPLLEHIRAQKAAQAAAKAKAAAKKAARRKAERSNTKKSGTDQAAATSQDGTSSPVADTKKKRERNRKKKEPRSSRPPKEGSNNKPKKQNNNNRKQNNEQPQVIKILGRQSSSSPGPNTTG